jgi:hypothetical protein
LQIRIARRVAARDFRDLRFAERLLQQFVEEHR